MKLLLLLALCLWIHICFLFKYGLLWSLKLFSNNRRVKQHLSSHFWLLVNVLLHHSPPQTIGGAVRIKQTGGVSWKLSKLDHLLLGCSRMMFLLFKFTSKVPNNAKQLGRTATTQQGLEWLLMWIRLHYPAAGRRGVDTERWCYTSTKDNALNATLQQREGICL